MSARDEISLMPDDDFDQILRQARGLEKDTVVPAPYEEPDPLPNDPKAQVPVLAERLKNALRDVYLLENQQGHLQRENDRLRGQIQARDTNAALIESRLKTVERGLEGHEGKLNLLKGWQDKNKLHAAYIAGAIGAVTFLATTLVPILLEHMAWK